MPRTKSTVREDYASLESAWVDGGELAVTEMAVRKYAQVIDVTESGRDMKPLITGLFEAIDRLKVLQAQTEDAERSPLFKIVEEARSA